MYRIIGGDQREYGPVSEEQVIQWIREGRANGATRIRAESGGDWMTLAALSEFAAALAAQPQAQAQAQAQSPGYGALPAGSPDAAGPAGSGGSRPQPSEHDLRSREPGFSLAGVLGEGWELFTRNFGLFFAATAIVLICHFAISLLSMIPILGMLFSLAGIVVMGPLLGGLSALFLRTRRGEPTAVGDVFNGFRHHFVPLTLAYVVMCILIFFACLPGVLVMVGTGVLMGLTDNGGGVVRALGFLLGGALVLIPTIYLGVGWSFSFLLVVDRDMHFWDAMQLSLAVVRKIWFRVFLLAVAVMLLYLGGLIMCLIGVFVTIPLAVAAHMLAYEKLFG